VRGLHPCLQDRHELARLFFAMKTDLMFAQSHLPAGTEWTLHRTNLDIHRHVSSERGDNLAGLRVRAMTLFNEATDCLRYLRCEAKTQAKKDPAKCRVNNRD